VEIDLEWSTATDENRSSSTEHTSRDPWRRTSKRAKYTRRRRNSRELVGSLPERFRRWSRCWRRVSPGVACRLRTHLPTPPSRLSANLQDVPRQAIGQC